MLNLYFFDTIDQKLPVASGIAQEIDCKCCIWEMYFHCTLLLNYYKARKNIKDLKTEEKFSSDLSVRIKKTTSHLFLYYVSKGQGF